VRGAGRTVCVRLLRTACRQECGMNPPSLIGAHHAVAMLPANRGCCVRVLKAQGQQPRETFSNSVRRRDDRLRSTRTN
jgi:hypothetical protein